MKKEQLTIRLRPIIKLALHKKAQEEKFKTLNDFINDILEKHIMKKEQENKILEKITNTNNEIENINEVLTKMLEVISTK